MRQIPQAFSRLSLRQGKKKRRKDPPPQSRSSPTYFNKFTKAKGLQRSHWTAGTTNHHFFAIIVTIVVINIIFIVFIIYLFYLFIIIALIQKFIVSLRLRILGTLLGSTWLGYHVVQTWNSLFKDFKEAQDELLFLTTLIQRNELMILWTQM